MNHLRVSSEGERLVVSRSRAPEAVEGLVCGALCTLLGACAWIAVNASTSIVEPSLPDNPTATP